MSISEHTCYVKSNLCFRDSLCMLACCGQDYYLDFLPSNFPHHLLSSGITLLGARPKTIQAIFMTDLRSIFVGLITLGRMDSFFSGHDGGRDSEWSQQYRWLLSPVRMWRVPGWGLIAAGESFIVCDVLSVTLFFWSVKPVLAALQL